MAALLNKHYWNEGSLSGEKIPESAVKLFIILNTISPILGLWNEILCILVAQETAILTKKVLPLGLRVNEL